MPTYIQGILRHATRQPGENLNIITFPGDTHYDISLCETGHDFWALLIPGSKEWDAYYPIPNNYHVLPTNNGQATLPLHVEFDLIIAHDRGPQYDVADHLSHQYRLPTVLVEHSLPPADWNEGRLAPLRSREGDTNVFIADCQKNIWGFRKDYDCIVNPLGVNTNLFSPVDKTERQNCILWIGNNIMYKDEMYGFPIMRFVTGFPMPMMPLKIIGNNPGISRLPNTITDLVKAYSQAGLLLNTCPNDPLPTTVLEAMACGCPVVSLAVGDIPQVIKNGETGFASKNPEELRTYCSLVLSDKELANRLSINGRELIRKKFGMTRFTKSWQQIITKALEE